MDVESILRMRAAGRTWSQVARAQGASVAAVREAIAVPLAARRASLARTPLSEGARGLLEPCRGPGSIFGDCRCPRKDHEGLTGTCKNCGPERDEFHPDYGHRRPTGCDEFYGQKEYQRRVPGDVVRALNALGLRKDRSELSHYQPKTHETYTDFRGNTVQKRMSQLESRPDMPFVRIETMVRRAKKKLK